jgi:hypothetical protein
MRARLLCSSRPHPPIPLPIKPDTTPSPPLSPETADAFWSGRGRPEPQARHARERPPPLDLRRRAPRAHDARAAARVRPVPRRE